MTSPDPSELTDEEQTTLDAVESGAVRNGFFLASSFPRILKALKTLYPDFSRESAKEMLVNKDPNFKPFKTLFWVDGQLTPAGEMFLGWVEGERSIEDLTLSSEDFTDYLRRSLSLYELLRLSDEKSLRTEPAREEGEEAAEVPEEAPVAESPLIEPAQPTEVTFEGLPADITEGAVFEFLDPEMARSIADDDTLRIRMKPATLQLWQEFRKAVLEMSEEQRALLESTAKDDTLRLKVVSVHGRIRQEPLEEKKEEEPPKKKFRPPVPEDEEADGELIRSQRGPLSPFENKAELVVRNKYLGYGKNSEGVVGLCGQLKVRRSDNEELVGMVESSNPLLFFRPVRLSGFRATVTYWLPPVAFPHPAGALTLRTSDEARSLPLHTLFPRSRTDFFSDKQVLATLLAPALIGILYFGLVYWFTVTGIDNEAFQLFPELYQAAMNGSQSVDFRSGGLGLYRLKIVPASESLQMIWAAIIFFCPLLSTKFFRYLSKNRQKTFAGVLAGAQLLPTLFLLTTWNFQGRFLPLYDHRDFAPLDLKGVLTWSIPANIIVAVYLFLSVFGVWDRKVKPSELRVALPVVLTLLYLVIMFVVIYGRSWLG